MRIYKLIVIALALAALGAASAQARPLFGISSQTALAPGEFERMGKGKVGTLRSQLSWAASEPSRGQYAWTGFDSLVSEAARNKITVLPFIFSSPDWVARGLDGRNCGDCGLFAPRRKASLEAWERFVGAAVDRYGRGGEFWELHPNLPKRPITAWQIWNEQNSKSFYRPRPDVKAYAKLLDRAARAISSRDKRADVVLGGMAELAGSRKAVAGSKYLRRLYDRRGTRRDIDGIAPHPYGKSFNSVRKQVDGFRREAKRGGDGRVGLWITETGWGSASGGHPLNVGKAGQAKRLKQTLGFYKRKRGALNVKNVTWFSWRDSRERICDWCPKSGLFTKSLKAKPSWRAFTRLSGGR
jgi:hypothetical protein